MGKVVSLIEYKRERRIPDRVGEILKLVDDNYGQSKPQSRLRKLLDLIKRDPAFAAATLNDHVWNG